MAEIPEYRIVPGRGDELFPKSSFRPEAEPTWVFASAGMLLFII